MYKGDVTSVYGLGRVLSGWQKRSIRFRFYSSSFCQQCGQLIRGKNRYSKISEWTKAEAPVRGNGKGSKGGQRRQIEANGPNQYLGHGMDRTLHLLSQSPSNVFCSTFYMFFWSPSENKTTSLY